MTGNHTADYYAKVGANMRPKARLGERVRQFRASAVRPTLACTFALRDDGGHLTRRFKGRWVCARCRGTLVRLKDLAVSVVLATARGSAKPARPTGRGSLGQLFGVLNSLLSVSAEPFISVPCPWRLRLAFARYSTRNYLVQGMGFLAETVGRLLRRSVPGLGESNH
eukprot:4930132-Pyramimonas_sp.AAC.1